MNLLFVCGRNQWRSPTAELLFKSHPFHYARSAGTSDKARIKINEKMLGWADRVFVMEHRHKRLLRDRFPETTAGKEIIVLDIEDKYTFGDPGLVAILTEKLRDYL